MDVQVHQPAPGLRPFFKSCFTALLVDLTDSDNYFQRYFLGNILVRLTPAEQARTARAQHTPKT